jgi:hypothetical protein
MIPPPSSYPTDPQFTPQQGRPTGGGGGGGAEEEEEEEPHNEEEEEEEPYNEEEDGEEDEQWQQQQQQQQSSKYEKVAIPRGNVFIPIVWCTVVLLLVVSDVVRCMLTITQRRATVHKALDIVWFDTSGLALPLLFVCVATQLGTHEMFLLLFVLASVVLSSVCALCAEELSTVAHIQHSAADEEVRTCVVWVLRTMHDASLFVVLLAVAMPFLFDVDKTLVANSVKTLLVGSFIGLTLLLSVTQFCNHRLYSLVSKVRAERRDTLAALGGWYPPAVFPTVLPTPDHPPSVHHYPVHHRHHHDDDQISKPHADGNNSNNTDQTDQTDQTEADEEVDDAAVHVQASLAMFNVLYGCHVYDTPEANRCAVDIAGGGTRKDSGNVLYGCHVYDTPEANARNNNNAHNALPAGTVLQLAGTTKQHRRSSCLHGLVLRDGVHMKTMGYAPCIPFTNTTHDHQHHHKHAQSKAQHLVESVALLVEWRRYYLVHMFVNVLVLALLLDMTDYSSYYEPRSPY